MSREEQAVLGSVLLANHTIHTLSASLSAGDFSVQTHAEIFSKMLLLASEGKPIDVVTLGGDPYILELSEAVPTAANAEHYAGLVRESSLRRRIGEAGATISSLAARDEAPAAEVLSKAESVLMSLSKTSASRGVLSARELIGPVCARIEKTWETGVVRGRPTGIRGLDNLQDGMSSSDLIIVAGRPAMGKSALAQQIMLNHLQADPSNVGLFFSLEMSADQLLTRAMSQISCIPSSNIANGKIEEAEWDAYMTARKKIEELHWYIDDSGSQTMGQICSRTRAVKASKGLSLVVVDYLGLIVGGNPRAQRTEIVGGHAADCKRLAKELDVPVVLLAQLNRGCELRDDKRPKMADLRDSGEIEQHADEIIFIYRDSVYNDDAPQRDAELLLAKNRDGATGRCTVQFDAESTCFFD